MVKGVGVLFFVMLACSILPTAHAQEDSKTTAKASDVTDKSDKQTVLSDDDPDSLLTNNKLRAESGSKSRFSIASTLAYNGGSISRPFGDYRPNIQDVNGQSPISDVEGGISLKYNITPRDSILLGETVRFVTPLSNLKTVPGGYTGQKVDTYSPALNYQRIYKVWGLQSYYQVGPGWETRTDYTRIGYMGNFGIYNVNAYDIGTSRFTVGLESAAQYAWFHTPTAHPDVGYSLQDTEDASTDYLLEAFPYLEYKINDKLNLRTVCMYFSIEHTLAHNGDFNVWTKDVAMQSVGLGISVTRDIFLYPNVQFIPDELRSKQTNVALSTDINLF